jgi:hypothetical protein
MAGTISTGEIEGWLHRMTVEPLPHDVVARVLESHRQVLAERVELVAQLRRPGAGLGRTADGARRVESGAGDLTRQIGSSALAEGFTGYVRARGRERPASALCDAPPAASPRRPST